MFGTLFLGTVLAVFLTLGAVRGDAERGLLQPLLVRPVSRRTLLLGRYAAAAGGLRRLRRRRLPRRDGDHVGDRRLVARPPARPGARARARGRDHRRAVAGRLGVPVLDRQRDRGLHGLRRRPRRRPARPDRRGAVVGHAAERRRGRELAAAVRGALPGRARRADQPTRSASRGSRSTSARSAARSPPASGCGCGRSSTSGSSARGRCEASRGGTYEAPVRPGRRLHRHAVRRQPGRRRARRRRASTPRRCSASRTGRTCPRRRSCSRRRTPQADYRVRIFTPVAELPFAGHPTLGTCHAWLAGRAAAPETVVQECAAGLVPVRRTPAGLAFAAPPLVRSGAGRGDAVGRSPACCGSTARAIVDAQWADNGPGWVAVLLESAEAVLAVRPRYAELDIGVVGPYPPGSPEAIEVRAFFPKAGSARRGPGDREPQRLARRVAAAHRPPRPRPTSPARAPRSAERGGSTCPRTPTARSGSAAAR